VTSPISCNPLMESEMNNKLVRQCNDTFIRRFGDVGYISSQLTKHDRVYDAIGAIFLENISRTPKDLDRIVENIHPLFRDVTRDSLRNDFIEFISDLERDCFVVTGDSTGDLDRKEPHFSYQMENPKTITYNFLNQDKTQAYFDTTEFFFDHFRENPTIFGAEMEVTSRCNERCLHCYLPVQMRHRDIDIDLCLDALDQLRDMRTVQVSFSGGELFLHRGIAEILCHARKNDFIITILSNATLITDESISLLKEININLIQVSLYSMRAEEHDAITQVQGSLIKTINAIERLIEANIPLQISCPVMKINKNSYRDVLVWANKNKVKAYTDFIMMARTDFSTSNLAFRLDLMETEKLIRDIIEVDESYRASLNLSPKTADLERFLNKPVCGVGIDSICLTGDGNLYPCAGFQGYVLGNIYEAPLRSIWDGSEQLKYLREITNACFPICTKCDARDYCALCLVRTFNESGGDMFKVNEHFCQVAHLNKKIVKQYNSEIKMS
jgi:radical SAM protein with 4Fe4S-binding SPASM domain